MRYCIWFKSKNNLSFEYIVIKWDYSRSKKVLMGNCRIVKFLCCFSPEAILTSISCCLNCWDKKDKNSWADLWQVSKQILSILAYFTFTFFIVAQMYSPMKIRKTSSTFIPKNMISQGMQLLHKFAWCDMMGIYHLSQISSKIKKNITIYQFHWAYYLHYLLVWWYCE